MTDNFSRAACFRILRHHDIFQMMAEGETLLPFEGEVIWDVEVPELFGGARGTLRWADAIDSSPTRAFALFWLGRVPVRFAVVAAVADGGERSIGHELRLRVDDLTNSLAKAASTLDVPFYRNARNLYYLERSGLQHSPTAEFLKRLRDTAVNHLELDGKVYRWRNPGVVGRLVGLPAGTADLTFDDILIGPPRRRLADDDFIVLPDLLRYILELKAVHCVWQADLAVHWLTRPPLPEALSDHRDTGKTYDAAIHRRREWLKKSLALQEEMRAVKLLDGVAFLSEDGHSTAIRLDDTVLPNSHFLGRARDSIGRRFAEIEADLAERERLSVLDLDQAREAFELWSVSRNIALQTRITLMTWALLLLTFFLAVLTIVLALDSKTLAEWISRW